MTTDKEKIHGRLDKNLKDRDLKLTQPITLRSAARQQIKRWEAEINDSVF